MPDKPSPFTPHRSHFPEKAITPDTALQLEKVVGVPAHIWTGLEAEYRLTLARQAEAQPTDNRQ